MHAENRLELEDDNGDAIIEDGLSACDEGEEGRPGLMTSSEAAARRAAHRSYRRLTLFFLLATLLASVAVAVVRNRRGSGFASRRKSGPLDEDGNQLDMDLDIDTPLDADTDIEDDDYGLEDNGTEDKGPEDKGPEDNGLGEAAKVDRLRKTLEFLIEKRVSDPEALSATAVYYDNIRNRLVYPPEYTAAVWIAEFDQFRIAIPAPRGEDDYPFLQRYSLAVLFLATGGLDQWLWRAGFLSGRHECEWRAQMTLEGVEGILKVGADCDGDPDPTDGREMSAWERKRTVTGINMPPFNNMAGTLPAEVRHLRYLKYLSIRYNEGIAGTIPFQYGHFPNLKYMDLAWNSLTGKIPRSFDNLAKLTTLRLQENQLSGDTTAGDLDFLRDLTDLSVLTLDHNFRLTGTFPESVVGLPKLRVLNLGNTRLGGRLPPSLSGMTHLRMLHLDDCDFVGSVEPISSLRNLTHLYLEDNAFNDTIHDGFLSNLTELEHLDLSNCLFRGWVPGHFFDLEKLKVLDMSSNLLQDDVIPADALARAMGSGLEYLSLHGNNITGPIPPGIKNLENLTVLDLSNNKLTGEVPVEMGWLTKLEILFLGRNDFDKGPLDDWGIWLRKTSGSLRELSLKGTNRNGTIPEWLREFEALQLLDLGENGLRGGIPQSLEALGELMVLILNQNRLEGQLGLGGLKKLETILIDDNDLTGDTDAMCAHKIAFFVADCAREDPLLTNPENPLTELRCDCCSLCCHDADVTCNDAEWLGNNNGIWEFGYQRVVWSFEEGGISPLLNYN